MRFTNLECPDMNFIPSNRESAKETQAVCDCAGSSESSAGITRWVRWLRASQSRRAPRHLGDRQPGPVGAAPRHRITARPAGRSNLHRTQKKWLAKQPAAVTINELQTLLDRFAEHYNTSRPHRALERHIRTHTGAVARRAGALNAGEVEAQLVSGRHQLAVVVGVRVRALVLVSPVLLSDERIAVGERNGVRG